MANERSDTQPAETIGFHPAAVKAAGRMMILIALSTGVLMLIAFVIGRRLDLVFGSKPQLTIICCTSGILGTAWINYRIARRTAAAVHRDLKPAAGNETDSERNKDNGR